jgi:hypothetical protein
MFATSHRSLRDNATKALSQLLTDRIDVAIDLLSAFAEVNDPYIFERVSAAVCGAAMRSTDTAGVGHLARRIVERFFHDLNAVPLHILTRDYLRLVIERAISVGVEIDSTSFRPPYTSGVPNARTKEELQAIIDSTANAGLRRAWFSVMHDDFGRYVIGTNSGVFNWLPLPPSVRTQSPSEIVDQFTNKLDPEQDAALKVFSIVDLIDGLEVEIVTSHSHDDIDDVDVYDDTDVESLHETLKRTMLASYTARLPAEVRDNPPTRVDALAHLISILGPELAEEFNGQVLPYINVTSDAHDARFDLGLIQRYVIEYLLRVGYDERLGRYDDQLASRQYSREPAALERIGKKYQWQGLHECLARIADNYPFTGEAFSRNVVPYQGAWQTGYRDIDPSFIPGSVEAQPREDAAEWLLTAPAIALGAMDSAPALDRFFTNLLERAADDGRSEVLLAGDYRWTESPPFGRDPYEQPRRDFWAQVRSYLIRASDASDWMSWATNQNWYGRWMPEAPSLHRVMRGEWYWAPAYRDGVRADEGGWLTQYARELDITIPLMVATVQYFAERGTSDASIATTYSFDLPGDALVAGLHVSWNGDAFAVQAESGTDVFVSRSAGPEQGRSLWALRAPLLDTLRGSEYALAWTLLAEARVLPASFRHSDHDYQTRVFSGAAALSMDGTIAAIARKRSEERP